MKKVRERGEKTNEKRKQTERMKIWKKLKETKGTIIIKIIIIATNNNKITNNNNKTAGELRENYTNVKLNLSKLTHPDTKGGGGWGRDIHLSRRQCPTPEGFDSAPQKA